MQNEQWRSVQGYEGLYEVSNLGNVRSVPRVVDVPNTVSGKRKLPGRMMKFFKNSSGYYRVCLNKDGGQLNHSVHRLVALAFCENDDPEHKTFTNHKDCNRLNNNADNLEWCTPQYNSVYADAAKKRGDTLGRPVAQYSLETGERIATFASTAKAARSIGETGSSGDIHNACTGKQGTAFGFAWRFADTEEGKKDKLVLIEAYTGSRRTSRSVKQYDSSRNLVSMYPTLSTASVAVTGNEKACGSISAACRGRTNGTWKGYGWEYATPDEYIAWIDAGNTPKTYTAPLQ